MRRRKRQIASVELAKLGGKKLLFWLLLFV
jgi:hypothetical protein